jgi:hypothetical protein
LAAEQVAEKLDSTPVSEAHGFPALSPTDKRFSVASEIVPGSEAAAHTKLYKFPSRHESFKLLPGFASA